MITIIIFRNNKEIEFNSIISKLDSKNNDITNQLNNATHDNNLLQTQVFDLNNFKILTSHKMQTLKDYNKHLESGIK